MSRVPPHNLEAETGVLGAAMLEKTAAEIVLTRLSGDDFYEPRHRLIFAAMQSLAHADEPIDEVTVGGQLRAAGATIDPGLLSSLTERVPTAANARHYADLVREASIRRKIITAAREIQDQAHAGETAARELADQASAAIATAAAQTNDEAAVSAADLTKDAFRRIELAHAGKGKRGLATGYHELDARLGGLLEGNLIIVAGRPSMGKTALAMNMAQGVAELGKKVLVFSLEMSRDEVADRLVASTARVDLNRIRTGQLGSLEWPRLSAGMARLHAAGMHIHDRADLSILELRSLARRHRAQHGLDLVVVDYLQLMSDSRDHGREREIADISRGLKGLAKELSIPVVALSQLSRACEAREDKRPRLSDLRESGAIEQDADVVAFVYRDDYYTKEKCKEPGVAEIIVAKNRNGSTEGEIKLRWFGQFTRFDNLRVA